MFLKRLKKVPDEYLAWAIKSAILFIWLTHYLDSLLTRDVLSRFDLSVKMALSDP